MMNNQKRNKSDEIKRQNRIVYTVLALSLTLLSVLIAVSVISQRNAVRSLNDGKEESITLEANVPTNEQSESTETEKETEAQIIIPDDTEANAEPEEVLPDFTPPAIGTVLKEYSANVPVYSQTMEDYRVHTGVDILTAVGDNVYAAATGTIGSVWEDPMCGCSLTIHHKGGAVSTYSNLSKETLEVLKPGMSILGGDVIATVGDTSLLEIADEPHLHYELSINNETVDPAEYISFNETENSYEG